MLQAAVVTLSVRNRISRRGQTGLRVCDELFWPWEILQHTGDRSRGLCGEVCVVVVIDPVPARRAARERATHHHERP
jgi:hypothetical protein